MTKTEGFAQPQRIPRVATSTTLWSTNNGKRSRKRESTLLDDFKTANGEILNPYRVLKVSRGAPRPEIKNAYRNLSKRYHPDGARFRAILPGTWYVASDQRYCSITVLILFKDVSFFFSVSLIYTYLSFSFSSTAKLTTMCEKSGSELNSPTKSCPTGK